MIALGLDIGGTKIEVQQFGPEWSALARRRIDTPVEYADLIDAIAGQVHWALESHPAPVPIGICSAGYANPVTGEFVAANLPASGKSFLSDITNALGQDVTFINDARAFAQSEAVFGAARHERTVVGVILGTGVGGGIVVDGQLLQGRHAVPGEFGHMAAPAQIVAEWDLPVVQCKCGRLGCIETLASGPGMMRLCESLTGQVRDPAQIAKLRYIDDEMAKLWRVWCALVAETLHSISLCVEPDVFVLGGGLSQISGIAEDLSASLSASCFAAGTGAEVRLAQGGDASGARGAAFAAWQRCNSKQTDS